MSSFDAKKRPGEKCGLVLERYECRRLGCITNQAGRMRALPGAR